MRYEGTTMLFLLRLALVAAQRNGGIDPCGPARERTQISSEMIWVSVPTPPAMVRLLGVLSVADNHDLPNFRV